MGVGSSPTTDSSSGHLRPVGVLGRTHSWGVPTASFPTLPGSEVRTETRSDSPSRPGLDPISADPYPSPDTSGVGSVGVEWATDGVTGVLFYPYVVLSPDR